MERASTGVDYRSVYIIKLESRVIEIDLIDHKIEYSRLDEILGDKQLIKNGAIKISNQNVHLEKIIEKYFEYS
jgi:hypothetical protein